MGRPDPRLILPATAVRRVPNGAQAWLRDGRGPYIVGACRVMSDGRLRYVLVGDFDDEIDTPLRYADDLLIDPSAPVDGERLDAWWWALGVSGIDHVTVESPTSAIVHFRDATRCTGGRFLGMVGIGATVADLVALGERETAPTIPGLDLSGLTPDDAARAVVVAALVAQGGARG